MEKKLPKILLVDDDLVVRDVTQLFLESYSFDVQVASNGLEALRRLESGRPDVILLDLNMPEMDGWQFLSDCRERDDLQNVPVIVVSAELKHPRENPVVASLFKPFEPDELLRLLQSVLRS